MGHPVFDHEGPWTEQAYLELSAEDGRKRLPAGDGRIELIDGALLVGPGSTGRHAKAVELVRAAVAESLPDGLRVAGPVPLRLGPDCVLVPDLVVTRAEPEPDAEAEPGAGPAVLDAADALMVLEVVGAEHGSVDRSFKPQLYARSRIPYSLLVDHDAPFAVANMIIGGRYHEYARAEGASPLRVEEPFGLEVDLVAVAARADHDAEDHDAVPAAG